ncbi:3-phosphoshikimate 1-carboxyvinyltransferase [Peptostreptococcus faecalis]|uniref:3-phosphoshikimate 1-carboxyvinyltransferase n=1 Tax=Peptostreptococcus faecalis TaxID=2045015 RepID=UPI000C7A54D6|nr:3-phosphoshikimate 1-carboxyvinyltransferase [Peptostreptococcus faecalis]
MHVEIMPTKLNGKITPPSSKSLGHRSIICASLGDGVSIIRNIYISDDIEATIKAMIKLGANIQIYESNLVIKGIYADRREDVENDSMLKKSNTSQNKNDNILKQIVKESSTNKKEKVVIDCGESGSTIRFLIPILTLFDKKFELRTKGNLLKRPLKSYYDILDEEGISYEQKEKSVFIEGGKVFSKNTYTLRGDISSQFITGLLYALPLLEHDSEIRIDGKLESKGYIDLTIDVLNTFGVKIENREYKSFKIKGNQKYISTEYTVETDYSQAAFFIVGAALGNDIFIENMCENSSQGDREILNIVRKFGYEIDTSNGELKITGKNPKSYSFDGSDIPDIVPILSLLASLSEGESVISDVGRLRIKESDRLIATCNELKKLGAEIRIEEDNLIISGRKYLDGGVEVSSHKDHRIAMMLAIAATVCKEKIRIEDAEYVSKSYPDFWERYRELGGVINVSDLGKKI